MLIEVIILGLLLYVILEYNGSISTNKFIHDNKDLFYKMKEKDYDFYAKAKYGQAVDIDLLFTARLRNGLLVIFILFLVFISDLSYIKLIIMLIAGYGMFKLPYLQIKSYYKTHLAQIDMMLPYYLKNLEILVQHYTVPVALGKSINDAPEIFRNGLLDLIEKIINKANKIASETIELNSKIHKRDKKVHLSKFLFFTSLISDKKKRM